MSFVKTQTTVFRDKFWVNQHDKVLRKQLLLGLRLKNLFSNEEIKEECSALHYRTDFTFKKHMLVVKKTCWQRSRLWKEKTKRTKKAWLPFY